MRKYITKALLLLSISASAIAYSDMYQAREPFYDPSTAIDTVRQFGPGNGNGHHGHGNHGNHGNGHRHGHGSTNTVPLKDGVFTLLIMVGIYLLSKTNNNGKSERI